MLIFAAQTFIKFQTAQLQYAISCLAVLLSCHWEDSRHSTVFCGLSNRRAIPTSHIALGVSCRKCLEIGENICKLAIGTEWCLLHWRGDILWVNSINVLIVHRTMVTICTASLTFSNYAFCPHSCIYVFCVGLRTNSHYFLHNINWLVFITEI